MTDPVTIFSVTRAVSAAMSALLIWRSFPSAYRLLFRRHALHRYYDALRSALLMIAFKDMAFNAQWLFLPIAMHRMQPSEMITKSALYCSSALAMFILLLTLRVYEHDCRDC